ncbi:MAG: hypothetical protein IJG13_22010, partial [Kiritimatiellae bacterium]|nr:hypothetical protein [Kiritimatiellia bacterium]
MNTKSNMAAWRVALGATFLSAATCMAADIPARGGVVPDGSGTDVSITSAGADGAGPITLEKSSTSVKSLVQRTGVDAVVDIAGGTLAAGAVGIAGEDSASLVVGSAPGDGALASLSGALAFSNGSTNGARLVVNSTVATSSSDTISVSGPGETHVASDFAHAGTLQLDGGTFSVTNATTITATLKGSGTFATEGLTTFKMPNVDFKDFTGEIVFRAGTNGFYNNSRLSTGKYRYRFEPGSQIDTTSGWYDTAGTHVSAAGDGVYGDGVAIVKGGAFARTFPYFTLTGDASVNPDHSSSWIQFGGSTYSKIFGLFDMGGHTLTKRDGSGYLRFENGAITNAGPIVLSDYTGNYAEYSRILLYTNFSLGGPGAPPVYMGSKTSIRMLGAQSQHRSVVVNGAGAK